VLSNAISSERRGSLIVLEGMPGAGRTTALGVLGGRGRQVVGEYLCARPGVDEDEAHQGNWIAKAEVSAEAVTRGHVFCDRDFLSWLAFAWSIAAREPWGCGRPVWARSLSGGWW
jgi:predicted ATPase